MSSVRYQLNSQRESNKCMNRATTNFLYNFLTFYAVQAVTVCIWAIIYRYLLHLPVDEKFGFSSSLILILLASLFSSLVSVLSLHLIARSFKYSLSRELVLYASILTTSCIIAVNFFFHAGNIFLLDLMIILVVPIGTFAIYTHKF